MHSDHKEREKFQEQQKNKKNTQLYRGIRHMAAVFDIMTLDIKELIQYPCACY